MDIRKLQRAIVDGLEDVKAQGIVVFNTEHLSPLFERVIIASGTSNRQTKALASSVRETVKKQGMNVLRTEGEENGEWIIVDCGAAVAHIMQPAIREYYHLEEIWGGKEVRMKLGDSKVSLVKASEPEPPARRGAAVKAAPTSAAAPAAAPARKAAAKKAAAPQVPARKASGRVGPRPAIPAPAPAPARKAVAPANRAVASPAGKTAAPMRKIVVPARKAAAAPARKAPARKTAVRKTAVRKTGGPA